MRAKSFGLYLREMRECAGFGLDAFSYELGLPKETVQAVERNLRQIPAGSWAHWAELLRMDPAVLVAMYMNLEGRRICLDNEIYTIFKIVPATQEDFRHGQSV